jgi:hypothetical protein
MVIGFFLLSAFPAHGADRWWYIGVISVHSGQSAAILPDYLFPFQNHLIQRQFIQKLFSEELQQPRTQCGSPMFRVFLSQPLLNPETSKHMLRLKLLIQDQGVNCSFPSQSICILIALNPTVTTDPGKNSLVPLRQDTHCLLTSPGVFGIEKFLCMGYSMLN